MKVIEALEFLRRVVADEQGSPGFGEALAVADVQATMIRSFESGTWEDVISLRID